MKTVMIAIEDSREAAGLTTLAAAAAGHGAELDVVHVVELGSDQEPDEAREAVASAVELLRARGLTCRGHVETTDCGVAERMVERVRQTGADLLVMGTRGLTGLAALRRHSVSHAVLADLDVPVLVVPDQARLPVAGVRRVLVAVGSEWDTSAAVGAVELLPDANDVLLVHVPRWAALHVGRGPGNTFAEIGGETSRAVLSDAVERFGEVGIPVTARTLERAGGVAEAIADAAHAWDADVIVVGGRRPADWEALVTGSTAHDVFHRGHCPVLVAGRRRSGRG